MNPFTFNASSPNNNPDQSDQGAQLLWLAKPNARSPRRVCGWLSYGSGSLCSAQRSWRWSTGVSD